MEQGAHSAKVSGKKSEGDEGAVAPMRVVVGASAQPPRKVRKKQSEGGVRKNLRSIARRGDERPKAGGKDTDDRNGGAERVRETQR